MEFEIEPLVGCDFLIFGEKRENLRAMFNNKYDVEHSDDEIDYYYMFSLIFKNDMLASIEFFSNEKLSVLFKEKDINNAIFKEAYEYLKKYDDEISIVPGWNCAISEKLGIILNGTESDNFENEKLVSINVMKKDYIKKEDLKSF